MSSFAGSSGGLSDGLEPATAGTTTRQIRLGKVVIRLYSAVWVASVVLI